MRIIPNARASDSPDSSFSDKYEVKETTRSQAYQDLKRILKVVFKLIAIFATLYITYRVLNFYVFLGFLLALPLTYIFFDMILHVPSRLVLVLHFAEDLEDSEKIAIFIIPEKKFSDFHVKGGNRVEFNTLSGQSLIVADDIDFEEKTITNPWFSELSNLEFFKQKNAFRQLKDWLVDLYSEHAELMANREALLLRDQGKIFEQHYKNIENDMMEPDAIAQILKERLDIASRNDSRNTNDGDGGQ